jgi:hypothetical protein
MEKAEAYDVRIEGTSAGRPVTVVARLHGVARPGSPLAVDGSRNRMIAAAARVDTARAPAPVRALAPEEAQALRAQGERLRAREASGAPRARAAAAYLRAERTDTPGRLLDLRA